MTALEVKMRKLSRSEVPKSIWEEHEHALRFGGTPERQMAMPPLIFLRPGNISRMVATCIVPSAVAWLSSTCQEVFSFVILLTAREDP